MSTTDLHRIEFGPNTLGALVELLSPHVPHSLPVLGNILNTCPRSQTIANVDPSQVFVWSTTPLPTSSSHVASPPPLFSILIFSPASHQFRFFCSAETSSGPPTEEEEAHVLHICRSVLRMAARHSPTYNSILTCKASTPDSHPTDRVETDPSMIVIGGVHEKWHSCLRPLSEWQNPYVRFNLPPTSLPHKDAQPSQGWIISQIRESDINVIRATTAIPRSVDYIRSRAPYSVCIRPKGTYPDDQGQKPIAWALMHADGSIGTLFVDPLHRGKGVAKLAINTLVQKLDLTKGYASTPTNGDLGGGTLGWNWSDTDVWNEKAKKLFHSLGGWREEWTCHWTYMVIPPQVTHR
ncbi:hypothetical protein F5I97DRAFT_1925105 [Phlebopus sp. FC_14]|nr:hypothetical protein F5I97DRAFT_1925105 [Phlebopus sp. FC_14]